MAANDASVARRSASPARLRWAVWLLALLLGTAAGVLISLLKTSHQSGGATNGPVGAMRPDATWAAGRLRAPGFRLTDQNHHPVSLAAYRGRPVIVTFIDPLCRNLCPLEAKVLNDLVGRLPAAQEPAIVAVSVNAYGNARANLLQDVGRWHLVPEWRWAVGPPARLASVWKRYKIGVQVTTNKIAGVTVHNISHTEAAYLVDATGYQRAIFIWPFRAQDVEQTLKQVATAAK